MEELCVASGLILSIISLFLKDNLSPSADYLKNVSILKELSTVMYLHLGCVNFLPLFFLHSYSRSRTGKDTYEADLITLESQHE